MHSCMKTASSVSSGKGSCSVMCLILWRSLFGVSFIWSHLQVTLKHHSIGIFSFSALTYMDRCFPLFTKKNSGFYSISVLLDTFDCIQLLHYWRVVIFCQYVEIYLMSYSEVQCLKVYSQRHEDGFFIKITSCLFIFLLL